MPPEPLGPPSPPTRRLAANFAYLLVARAVPALLSFLLLVFAARRLGADSFGQFAAAFAFTALLSTLTDLGLGYLVTREVARDHRQAGRVLSGMMLILGALFGGTLLVTLLLVFVFGYRSPVREAIYVLTFSWGFTAFTNLFGSVFQAFERMERMAAVWVGRNALLFVLGAAVLARRPGVVPLAWAFLAGSAGGCLLGYALTDRRSVRLDLGVEAGYLKQLLVTGIPFGFAVVLQTLYFREDEVILSVLRPPRELGLYAAAARIIQGLVLVPSAVTLAVFPRLARWGRSDRPRLQAAYQRMMKSLFFLGLPLAVGGTLLAPELVSLLYGPDYADAAPALRILLWALLLLFLASGCNITLNALDEVATTARILGVCLVVNLTMNFILVPSWGCDLGYRGASIATVVSEAANVGLLLTHMARRHEGLRLGWRWGAALAAAAAMSVALILSGALPLVARVLVGAVVFGGVLWVSGGFDERDRLFLREIRGT